MNKKAAPKIKLIGRCVGCNKTKALTQEQMKDGKMNGAALSSCCYMPLVVEEATITNERNKLI